MQCRDDRLASQLKEADGPLPRHGRETIEEDLERVSSLEVIEQGLDRNSGSAEDGRAAHDLAMTDTTSATACRLCVIRGFDRRTQSVGPLDGGQSSVTHRLSKSLMTRTRANPPRTKGVVECRLMRDAA